jgi:hypothetical protein
MNAIALIVHHVLNAYVVSLRKGHPMRPAIMAIAVSTQLLTHVIFDIRDKPFPKRQ